MRYQAAIFDFDGTIFDTGEGISSCIARTLETMGKPPLSRKDLNSFVGPSLFESFADKCGIYGDEAVEAIRIFRQYYQHEGGVYLCSLYDGMDGLLKDIKVHGMMIAVASSKPQVMVELLLEKHGLMQYFDHINAASGAEENSDKADKVKDCVKTFGFPPEKCVMVGDRIFDIAAAKAAGTASVYTLYGYGSKDEMEKSDPTYCAATVAELKSFLLS